MFDKKSTISEIENLIAGYRNKITEQQYIIIQRLNNKKPIDDFKTYIEQFEFEINKSLARIRELQSK